jgi:DNA topoisomerase-1
MSALGEVPEDLDFTFPSVRVLTEEEKSKLSSDTMASLVALGNAGYLTKPQVLKEIKQQSDVTGFGTNVTDEDIEAAERDEDMGLGGLGEMAGGGPETEPSPDTPGGAPTQAADEWSESDHPREKGGENGGQFTSGSGGGSSAPAKGQGALAPAPADRKKWPEHIKSLKLPPAWTDVRVSDDPKADLLAVGKDAKGRSQYVYSERFQNSQAEAKFARIKELDSKFGSIRKQNKSLQQSSAAREKDNADCAALIMAMGIRPGSESDTKAKVKAYGATTLEGRHVVEKGGAVYLEFTGKKGVAISLPVGDPKLAESLKERASRAGQGGKLFPNASEKTLLNHTHTLDGGGFKTKDFRTLLATRWASEQVKLGQPPKNEREYKKRVLDVAKHVSANLGNTPTVALQSYINPAVFAPWRSAIAA